MQVDIPQVLFKNRHLGRPATIDEYMAGGGYQALTGTDVKPPPAEGQQLALDGDLRGRGVAGGPAGRKWQGIPADHVGTRYVVINTDEM